MRDETARPPIQSGRLHPMTNGGRGADPVQRIEAERGRSARLVETNKRWSSCLRHRLGCSLLLCIVLRRAGAGLGRRTHNNTVRAGRLLSLDQPTNHQHPPAFPHPTATFSHRSTLGHIPTPPKKHLSPNFAVSPSPRRAPLAQCVLYHVHCLDVPVHAHGDAVLLL